MQRSINNDSSQRKRGDGKREEAEESETTHEMADAEEEAIKFAERLDRAFFGLDERTLDLLEVKLARGEDDGATATTSSSVDPSIHASGGDCTGEDFSDLLQGFGDGAMGHNNDDDDDHHYDEEMAGDCGPTNALIRCRSDGDVCGGVVGMGRRDLLSEGTSSSMWEGLGVEDGGMGLREVSQNAAENGYSQFLEEVELIREVFKDNGEVELIRAKPTTTSRRVVLTEEGNDEAQTSAGATAAASGVSMNIGKSRGRLKNVAKGNALRASAPASRQAVEEGDGKILSVRVQIMPLRILAAFNNQIRSARGRSTFGVGGLSSGGGGGIRSLSKGLHVVASYVNGYPDRPPLISIEPWHNLLPTDGVIMLNKKVVEIIQNSIGSPLIMSVMMMIAQEAEMLMDSYGEGDMKEIASAARGIGIKTRLASEAMHPDKYLGKSIADIVASLPRSISVQCVENVMRTDLALQFEKMQRYLFEKNVKPYMKMKNIRNQTHILEQAEAVISYHGTRMETVGYIVRDGLLVPGGDTGIDVRCGSRFGNGIYSSPDPNFAAMYAQRVGSHYKLILCATLLGKAERSDDYEPPETPFDSRIADDGVQYIVFHRAQILPCYILHINIYDPVTMQQVFPELRNTRQAEMRDIDDDANEGFFDKKELQKRRREVLTRMALKNLPFGFGPRGVNFVVEDVAHVSDDEDFLEVIGGGAMARIHENYADEMYQHETIIQNRYGTSHAHPTKF